MSVVVSITGGTFHFSHGGSAIPCDQIILAQGTVQAVTELEKPIISAWGDYDNPDFDQVDFGRASKIRRGLERWFA